MSKPVFITFTSPTCSGKSYLLSYIRDVAKLPCFVSTTTRPPREGEVDGVDYFFITDEESRAIEAANGFAELVTFNKYRYGVTKEEFKKKLDMGVAFLVVEPEGIDHYAAPALEVGALWLRYFIEVPEFIRITRFTDRFVRDVQKCTDPKAQRAVIDNYIGRFYNMITRETKWKDMHSWNRVLSGSDEPSLNLAQIMKDVDAVRSAPDRKIWV